MLIDIYNSMANINDTRRGVIPQAPSPKAFAQLSNYRQASLKEEVSSGLFAEGTSNSTFLKKSENTGIFANTAIVSGMKKYAQIAKEAATGSTSGSLWNGYGGTVRLGPELYSPLWLTSNTHLPRDRGTMNSWCRAFFALNPIVNNAISLHATYPISKLNITCKDKKIEQKFNEMAEEMDLLNTCVQMAQEFFVLGEVFPVLDLDESSGYWKRCTIQNPDFMVTERSAVVGEPRISYKPDNELKNVVLRNDKDAIRQRSQLPPEIIKYVKAGKNIPLDNFYVSHLARKVSPYDTRGTSLISPCFKALMLWDKMRECKYAQADSLINPITLVKLGGSADQEYKASAEDIERWRSLLEEAENDKNFKIISHGSVTIERIGAQAVIDVSNDITQLIKEIYIGLMVPQVIMEAGDITYANGGLSLDVLRQRYLQFQNMMKKWIRMKVFAPICELNEMYTNKDGERILNIPDIEWNHMSLFDLNDYINVISQLVGERKLMSVHTLYRSLGTDYETEQRQIRKEAVVDAIHAREGEILSRMSLTELRALGDDPEIPDIPDSPVPGESANESPLAGEEGEGGGGMGGMGGMPSPAPAPAPAPA